MAGTFDKRYGSELLKNPIYMSGLIVVVISLGLVTAKGGLVSGIGILAMPFLISYLYIVFMMPKVGIIAIYLLNFTAIGLSRYLQGVPFGLSIDGNFLLIYAALFFSNFFKKVPWKNAKNDLVLLSVIWYGYALFQLVNPEAISRVAWFYAMRGVALYMLFTLPLIFILFNTKKDLDQFLKIWAIMSILGTLKGIMQKFMGVDAWEQAWLDAGSASTHLLFGKLRVFSFYSDAGQFGAAQGHVGVVFMILGLSEKRSKKLKIFYFITAILGLYGLMISGTRGAMAVPVMGFAMYIILKKNIKIMVLGGLMGVAVLVFFKYTTIGQSNYSIARMRTAFNPTEDASYQVRRANQRKLSAYMASRPFGGGIGSAGNWGLRFTPHTFLANTPTDSWYVMIWAEQGVIGLALHLFILLYILFKSMYLILFKVKDKEINAIMCALASGYFGIMVASYGNGVLGQMPTGIMIYSSMAFLFLGPKLEKDKLKVQDEIGNELKQN
ncbi:O-antigen ligase family protein [uncultured Draconibacterium sp.]|uniref:O-antigen ligase family protein n=1 Tax=uncultured Draconibacterium sp. TaxID=1573823 RepID=UPI002AA8889D|nr:O-antigen ligase family protein [uncultured Draconibacterium sp.]